MHFDILDRKRVKILPKLKFLREFGFYLGGGTALALQIRHRISRDFDFYTPDDFDPYVLSGKFIRVFKKIVPVHTAEGTLMVAVDNIEMSFFRYSYPLLRPLVKTEYVDLLSLEDIAAMKMIAIVQRGTKRDFIDIYCLLKNLSLERLFDLTRDKYKVFNKYIGLRALAYFNDAEKEKSGRGLTTFEKVGWDKIKKRIIDLVDKYRKEELLEK